MIDRSFFKRVGVGLLLIVAVVCSADGTPAGAAEGKYFYYSDGQTFTLRLSTSRIALRLHQGQRSAFSASAPSIMRRDTAKHLERENITLFDFKKPVTEDQVESLMQALRQDPSVALVPLTFASGSTEMIVTDEFIAQFDPSLGEDDIRSLVGSYRVEILKPLEGSKNTYVLRIVGNHALHTANAFHRMGGVIYAHPNFLRIRHDPARIHPGETVMWGPEGERYFGDKEALKGTDRYRGIEPATAAIPQPLTALGPYADVSRSQIKNETFEGVFPNTWTLYGDPAWGRTTYRKYAGLAAGYCVGSSVPAPGPYPNNTDSWMVFGPFSLVGAQDARVNLQAWIHTESGGYDKFSIYASTNGTDFYGHAWWGNWAASSGGSGWMNIGFDLKRVYTLGNLLGQPQVWIALRFYSDYSVTYEGAYVDNVVVEKITGGYTSITSDVYDHLQWSLKNTQQLWGTSGADIKAVDAWGISHGSGNTVIAIVDEGVDLTHPDLAGKLVSGYDATGSGSGGAPSGDDAHGTNCAGIAAALTENAKGVAGIARLAKIMPVRVGKTLSGGGWTYDSWCADGINWAVNHGADVLSNSWGGGTPATVLTNAIKNAKTSGRGGKGAVVLFSSGNDNGPVSYPATLSEVIAVGALSPCDERKAPTSCDGEWWWGSNYGNELDISAPGVHMYSTDIQGAAGYDPGDYYYNFNGTSSACPVVAGVAGLLLGKCPQLRAADVEQILQQTADDRGASGWDPQFGYGRVNAYKALMQQCRQGGGALPAVQLLLLH